MNLHLYKTLWGHQGSLADAIRACVTQKWAGIEGPAPAEPAKQREFSAMLRDAGLEFIAETCTAGGYVPRRLASLSDHLESVRRGAEAALECHAQLWESQRARGMAACTMTPEFGPDGYLHTAPFTGVPVADLDQINAWMGVRLRRQFSAFAAARMVESVGGT